MSETTKSVVDGFRELRKFCQHVSLLLITADGLMKENGWSPKRAPVTGHLNKVVNKWRNWLPRAFYRFYASREYPHYLLYIAVLLDPPDEQSDPGDGVLLLAGWLDFGARNVGGKPPWGEYWFFQWHRQSKDRESGEFCRIAGGNGRTHDEAVEEVTFFAYPLDGIDNTGALKDKIIRPLVAGVQQAATTKKRRAGD